MEVSLLGAAALAQPVQYEDESDTLEVQQVALQMLGCKAVPKALTMLREDGHEDLAKRLQKLSRVRNRAAHLDGKAFVAALQQAYAGKTSDKDEGSTGKEVDYQEVGHYIGSGVDDDEPTGDQDWEKYILCHELAAELEQVKGSCDQLAEECMELRVLGWQLKRREGEISGGGIVVSPRAGTDAAMTIPPGDNPKAKHDEFGKIGGGAGARTEAYVGGCKCVAVLTADRELARIPPFPKLFSAGLDERKGDGGNEGCGADEGAAVEPPEAQGLVGGVEPVAPRGADEYGIDKGSQLEMQEANAEFTYYGKDKLEELQQWRNVIGEFEGSSDLGLAELVVEARAHCRNLVAQIEAFGPKEEDPAAPLLLLSALVDGARSGDRGGGPAAPARPWQRQQDLGDLMMSFCSELGP